MASWATYKVHVRHAYCVVWMRRKKIKSDWPSSWPVLKTWLKKLRTENLGLKIKMRNIEQTQQKTTKQNEELKTAIKKATTRAIKILLPMLLTSKIHSSTCVEYLLNNSIFSIFSGIVCHLTAVNLTICRHFLHHGVRCFCLKYEKHNSPHICWLDGFPWDNLHLY